MQRTICHRGFLVACAAILVATFGCKESQTTTPPASPATAGPAAEAPAVPLGLGPAPVPADNPMTAEKIELGKMLYFDKRLSKDGTVACATCHDPTMAWAENRATSAGIHEQVGGRNSPTVINAAYLQVQFWDGRAASLEEQALGPIENPIEMGNTMENCRATIEKIAGYKELFQKAFGSPEVTDQRIAQAIATFERTVLSGKSPYDRHVKENDEKALTEAQKRGMEVFMDRGQCATCHTPPIFSNSRYYNAGVDAAKPNPDEGRKKVTGKDSDMGKFRVPALREIANTGPYLHDGSAATLVEAVKLMASGGIDNPNLSLSLKSIREAGLTEEDIQDLAEFLKALSGEFPVIEPPGLPE